MINLKRTPDPKLDSLDIEYTCLFPLGEKSIEDFADSFSAPSPLSIELRCEIKPKKSDFTLSVEYAAIFNIENFKKPQHLINFMQITAPSIVHPYIRQTIHDIFSKCQLPPMVLPPNVIMK